MGAPRREFDWAPARTTCRHPLASRSVGIETKKPPQVDGLRTAGIVERGRFCEGGLANVGVKAMDRNPEARLPKVGICRKSEKKAPKGKLIFFGCRPSGIKNRQKRGFEKVVEFHRHLNVHDHQLFQRHVVREVAEGLGSVPLVIGHPARVIVVLGVLALAGAPLHVILHTPSSPTRSIG